MRPRPSLARLALALGFAMGSIALPALIRMLPVVASAPGQPAAAWLAHLLLAASASIASVVLQRTGLAAARLDWERWSADLVRSAVIIALVVSGTRWTSGATTSALLSRTVVLVVGPAAEELVFRAILPELLDAALARLARRTRSGITAVVSSVAFAAAHPWDDGRAFLASTAFGLLFHAVRTRGGGLETAILAHAAVNAGILGAMG